MRERGMMETLKGFLCSRNLSEGDAPLLSVRWSKVQLNMGYLEWSYMFPQVPHYQL